MSGAKLAQMPNQVPVGVSGVEGVMRSCCEKTLGVLRQNKESLITIIEVCNAKRKCARILTCSTYASRAIPSVITLSVQKCMFRSGMATCTKNVEKLFVLWVQP